MTAVAVKDDLFDFDAAYGMCDPIVDVRINQPCYSFDEARAKALATVKAAVPGLGYRSKSFINRWKRQLWEPAHRPLLAAAAQNAGTSLVMFQSVMMQISTYTSLDGKDAVYARYKTVGSAIPGYSKVTGGICEATVKKCVRAGEELGFITKGHQKKWMETDSDGVKFWVAGSSARLLLMPHLGLTQAQIKKQQDLERAQLRTEQAHREAAENKQRREAERVAYVDSIISAEGPRRPPEPPDKLSKRFAKEALAKARKQLE